MNDDLQEAIDDLEGSIKNISEGIVEELSVLQKRCIDDELYKAYIALENVISHLLNERCENCK